VFKAKLGNTALIREDESFVCVTNWTACLL